MPTTDGGDVEEGRGSGAATAHAPDPNHPVDGDDPPAPFASPSMHPPLPSSPEQIEDDGGETPPLPPVMLEASFLEPEKPRATRPGVEELVDEGEPPLPIPTLTLDEGAEHRVGTKSRVEQIDGGEESPADPFRADGESYAEAKRIAMDRAVPSPAPSADASTPRIAGSVPEEREALREIHRMPPPLSAADQAAVTPEVAPTLVAESHRDTDQGTARQSLPVIPEAYLVEDGPDVVSGYAEPLVPWWKQRHTKLLFGFVFVLAVAAAAAVAVGVRSSPAEAMAVVATSAPSASWMPSSAPTPVATSTPSTSRMPSSAPTSCAARISSNNQTLDMQHEDPFMPRVVVDGTNALAVAHGSTANSAFNVVFFSLIDEEWERTNVFIRKEFDQYFDGGWYSSAISGRNAFVGLWKTNTNIGEMAGVVEVYRQDDSGLWEKAGDPLIPDHGGFAGTRFGWSVDMDGDLACVVAAREGTVYLFQYGGGQWEQLDVLFLEQVVHECLIEGDMIATQTLDANLTLDNLHLHRYDRGEGAFKLLQDPLPANGFKVMSQNYLIYSTGSSYEAYEGVHIYYRQNERDPFSPLQFINASDYDEMFGAKLALDGDVLAVHAKDAAIIFTEQNGHWEEALVLDGPFRNYQVSGRTMLATTFIWEQVQADPSTLFHDEIYSFNLEDCTQKMPTQMPTSSIAPTASSSFVPCYAVNVEIVFDGSPGNTAWDITMGTGEDEVVVKSYEGSWIDSSKTRSWTTCLTAGQYTFSIYDNEGNGLCCELGEGSYGVTSAGETIAQGGIFERIESTHFAIPYDPSPPSSSPSSSDTPSSPPSLPPSMNPSLSLSPTEACQWLEVSVLTDEYPGESSWIISEIITDDDGRPQERPLHSGGRPTADFRVDGRYYSASHITNTAQNVGVSGALCDCGQGTSQCDCQGDVCLIQRGGNLLHEKVANCEASGGLVAIIYDDAEEIAPSFWTLGPEETAGIPAVFVSKNDGQALLLSSLGQIATITVSDSQPLEASAINTRRICLVEGRYQFHVYDTGGDGICCFYGEGHYELTAAGKIIAEGGAFELSEVTYFEIPFTDPSSHVSEGPGADNSTASSPEAV